MSGLAALGPARLQMANGRVPRSARFSDVYRSAAGMAGEAMHVYVDGNNLHERFSKCRGEFTIAELGFGTGLNLLMTLVVWAGTAPKGARLHYHAWEAYPLSAKEWKAVYRKSPTFAEMADRLRTAFPPLWPGWHSVDIDGNITLTLAYEDAARIVDSDVRADAWFLDGFAPSKNPEMWTEEVLAAVAERTNPGGTASTFTAAGAVRRRLEAAGMEVRSAPGFSEKGEMTVARKPGKADHARFDPGKVAVVGAGIAGASVAREFDRNGADVSLFDADPRGHESASANPSVVLSARLTAHDRARNSLAVQSFSNSLRMARNIGIGSECGMLSLGHGERDAKRQESVLDCSPPKDLARRLKSKGDAKAAGLPAEAKGMLLPKATVVPGWEMVSAIRADVRSEAREAASLERGWGGKWVIGFEDGGKKKFDTVVLCASAGCDALAGGRFGFRTQEGQMYQVPVSKASARMRVALRFGNILTPAGGSGSHFLSGPEGAPEWLADWLEFETATVAWKSVRCYAADRLPVAGRVEDGLYVLSGLGARGFTYGPQLALDLVAGVYGSAPRVPRHVAAAVAPSSGRGMKMPEQRPAS